MCSDLFPAHLEQRPDDLELPAPDPKPGGAGHSGQTRGTGPPQKIEKNRLSLIVRVMGQEDALDTARTGAGSEKVMPCSSRRRLE